MIVQPLVEGCLVLFVIDLDMLTPLRATTSYEEHPYAHLELGHLQCQGSAFSISDIYIRSARRWVLGREFRLGGRADTRCYDCFEYLC